MGEGRCFPLVPPTLRVALGLGAGVKGGGGIPAGVCEGGVPTDTAPIFAAAPVFPRSRASFVCYARVRERDARVRGVAFISIERG